MLMMKTLSKIGLWLLFPFAILADVVSILFTVASVCTGDADLVWFGATSKLFCRLTGRKHSRVLNPSDLGMGLATSDNMQSGKFDWLRWAVWAMLAAVLVLAVCLLVFG